ncbi:Signal transduction histidine kinase [Polaromonas sp. YR568]|uniref:ATP-binding protein n=1 Tax=Polaromonas sp. YR568 TaxID=1855301 RepID=UPI0008E80F1A|nr:ATP-binding protein [Polaromonas sp. YR568]SFU74820.1 Signal transduction histidine kinase [Polaromonas sp. YR568]
MWTRFTSHLYVRIWLAVVATVVVLTFLVGAAWRLSADPPQLPIREVLVHNDKGEVIGTAQTKPDRKLGDDLEFDVVTKDGQVLSLLLPRPKRPPSNPWIRPPFGFGFGWMLGLVGLAVAVGAYPVMRRLTQRLEALQRGVERWGAGDLSARVNADGTDEVAFLARRFNHAAERIETLMESHKSLLANASHELRSPLARIRMGLELMGTDAASPQRKEISRSINELDQLIDEILLASRLDAKQADAEPFETLDLTGLAAEECARVNAELSAELGKDTGAGLGIDASSHSLTVQGSPRLLRRLIRNLLENARRYSTGEINLELAQARAGSKQLAVVKVHDRGPGVPADQRERIFEPFYRLPGASEREGGVGLGLALVKSISQRHGGSVRCEARPGGGASFVVELPVAH